MHHEILSFPAWIRHLCFAAVLLHAQAPAPTAAPLTLRQVLQIAATKNPSLLAALQHVDATKAAEITAGLRVNPTFTLSGANTTLPADNPSSPYTYVGNVSRLFERGQKRHWRLAMATQPPMSRAASSRIRNGKRCSR